MFKTFFVGLIFASVAWAQVPSECVSDILNRVPAFNKAKLLACEATCRELSAENLSDDDAGPQLSACNSLTPLAQALRAGPSLTYCGWLRAKAAAVRLEAAERRDFQTCSIREPQNARHAFR